MLRAGWTEAAARNALLLLMVLFENIHIGNCRSETKSALRLSPFRSPDFARRRADRVIASSRTMFMPLGQRVLQVEPVSLTTMACLWTLALSIFVAMEIHKLMWSIRFARNGA